MHFYPERVFKISCLVFTIKKNISNFKIINCTSKINHFDNNQFK